MSLLVLPHQPPQRRSFSLLAAFKAQQPAQHVYWHFIASFQLLGAVPCMQDCPISKFWNPAHQVSPSFPGKRGRLILSHRGVYYPQGSLSPKHIDSTDPRKPLPAGSCQPALPQPKQDYFPSPNTSKSTSKPLQDPYAPLSLSGIHFLFQIPHLTPQIPTPPPSHYPKSSRHILFKSTLSFAQKTLLCATIAPLLPLLLLQPL